MARRIGALTILNGAWIMLRFIDRRPFASIGFIKTVGEGSLPLASPWAQ